MRIPETDTAAAQLLAFIRNSPSCFHAVRNVASRLSEAGFVPLREDGRWQLTPGTGYFVTRNSSSIAAFVVPPDGRCSRFKICAAHSDSPSFKIKGSGELRAETAYVKLNVEKYGGMLCAPWFDRPLSVAGRVICREEQEGGRFRFSEHLVNVDRDLLLIPSLAIHMNREANNGLSYNVQDDMLPVFSCGGADGAFWETVADAAAVARERIAAADLFLYARDPGTFWGAQNEFIASPRLDDLECVYAGLEAFLRARPQAAPGTVSVFCVFDNEEVGSETRQGAASTFLHDCLRRLSAGCGGDEESYLAALAQSFLVSADNAHAVHPNHASCADPANRPRINGGPVLKFNGAQKYTTDAYSAAVFSAACERAGVPCQIFTNRSDMAGGSTLGNISNTQVSIPAVDVGIAQWAMHSPVESAGAHDPLLMVRALEAWYRMDWEVAAT